MKKNYNLDELENFLSESAEAHRMYPSDRVWRNIDSELHGKKRWPALTFGAILVGAIITAGLILIHPNRNIFTMDQLPNGNVSQAVAQVSEKSSTSTNNSNISSPVDKGNSNSLQPINSRPKVSIASAYFGEVPEKMAVLVDNYSTNENPIASSVSTETEMNIADAYDQQNINVNHNESLLEDTQNKLSESNTYHAANEIDVEIPYIETGNSISLALNDETSIDDKNLFAPIVTNAPIEQSKISVKSEEIIAANKDIKTKKAAINRWNVSYYGTPSASYRVLNENKEENEHLPQRAPVAPNVAQDVNKFVRHKPLLGVEAGVAFMYNITPEFRLKAGIQGNYRQYGIQAYTSLLQTSTILLNGGYYTDSLISITSISNRSGYESITLRNKSWQVSVPVGFDLKVAGWKKFQFYIAGSVQPTYQLNKDMYLLSSNYKNYVQNADLVRQWNLNTAVEAFFSYNAGGFTLQAGPQIRYQMLSSAIKEYPIRENLVDYGIKIGIVKTLQ